MDEEILQTGKLNHTEREVYELLLGKFKDVFADLVILTGKKPSEILFELESVLSHLAVSKLYPEEEQENVNMAMRHLQRASLDAAKMLWVTYVRRIEASLPDRIEFRKYVLNCADAEYIKLFTKAEELGLNARRIELENMGRNPSESMDHYYNAVFAIREAYLRIDPEKVQSFLPLSIRYFVERNWLGFVLGIISSALVAMAQSFLG